MRFLQQIPAVEKIHVKYCGQLSFGSPSGSTHHSLLVDISHIEARAEVKIPAARSAQRMRNSLGGRMIYFYFIYHDLKFFQTPND